jgi:hypothetical protein
VKVAGLDIGFSVTRPSAGVGFFDGQQVETKHCKGIDACRLIVRSGRYDIAAIDGLTCSRIFGPPIS